MPNQFFGTDGIRGKVGIHPLTPEFALKLGQAAGEVLGKTEGGKTIIIGRDTRGSGPMLQSALTAGLLASGMTVVDVGVITTPGVAYLVRRMGAVAGVVISASHNPVKENGIKFFDQSGFKLPEAVEAQIESLLLAAHWQPAIAEAAGRMMDGRQMQEFYIESLTAEHPDLRLNPLNIVLDCANGAAFWIGPETISRLGARLVTMHASPTGLNINDACGSEFARKHPQDVGRLIQETNANFAIAFDGDADRVVFVDELGNLVDGDAMLALLARYFDQKGQLVARSLVTTPMRNQGMYDFAVQNGLTVHEVPVGDRNVVEKLLELRQADPNQFALGAEQAGHVAIVDAAPDGSGGHTTGDGIRTALFVMRVYVESGAKTFSEFTSIIHKTPQVIASAFVGAGPRLSKDELAVMRDACMARNPSLTRVNLRYSGTEPLFRAMLEGDLTMTEQQLADIAGEICRTVQAKAGVENGKLEILNTTRGGILQPKDAPAV
jgi:phosphoglucosamine mutase